MDTNLRGRCLGRLCARRAYAMCNSAALRQETEVGHVAMMNERILHTHVLKIERMKLKY